MPLGIDGPIGATVFDIFRLMDNFRPAAFWAHLLPEGEGAPHFPFIVQFTS